MNDDAPTAAAVEPWEDYGGIRTIVRHGPVEVCAVPRYHVTDQGVTNGLRHYAWLDYRDEDREAWELRELAAHLLAAADHLDRLHQLDVPGGRALT